MEWNERIEGIVRIFARQTEDVSPQFEEIRHAVREVCQCDMTTFPITDVYMPCKPEQVEVARGKGYLLTEYRGALHFVVREQRYQVFGGDNCNDFVQALADLGKFASLQHIREAVTEVLAT